MKDKQSGDVSVPKQGKIMACGPSGDGQYNIGHQTNLHSRE